MNTEGRALRWAVLALVLAGLVAPILAGLVQTARAAFGLMPAIGAETLSLAPWRRLAGLPGFASSLRLTLVTGFGATLLALLLAAGAVAALYGAEGRMRGQRLLAPFLAVPHAALAIGLAFVIAPSGWVVRGLGPGVTGWDRPPDLALVNDPWGGALILGMLLKEVPFLLLMMASALTQLPVRAELAVGRALGYGRAAVWARVILPQLYPLVRLPVYVVLAFSLSVVDMALILGPSNPPTLAVAVTRWFTAPDTALILPASAAALLQAVLVTGGIVLWAALERGVALLGRHWLRRGGRGGAGRIGLWLAPLTVAVLMLLALAALLALVLWSLAWRWPYPLVLPDSWSLRGWADPAAGWGRALRNSATIGLATTTVSLALAIAWLEAEDRTARSTARSTTRPSAAPRHTPRGKTYGKARYTPRTRWASALIWLPLLLPQIGFLYGLNVVFIRLGLSGGLAAVIWAQMLFVFPYVMIALTDPWRALDPRLIRTAAALGAGPTRRLIAVKLPLLARPLLTAAAVGFGVSVAQYLPTLFMGAGRIATLTTEAVTLASGADRRVVGVYAVLQAALPFAAYAAALAGPGLRRRRRQHPPQPGAALP